MTARPTFCLCRRASVSIAWMYGSPGPRKAASRNSAMGSRRQLVLYHDQLRAAGQKPSVPRRHWRRRARRHEIQSREIHLALPPVPAYAGSSACNRRVSTRAGNGNNRQELKKNHCWKTWRRLATRFLRQVARSSRTRRENQLHPDESGPQRIVPASRGLVVGISSKRPPAAASVAGSPLHADSDSQDAARTGVTRPIICSAHSPRRASCMTRPTKELRQISSTRRME